ncbi:MAG: hypothetical protein KDK71_07290, partial [Chlamydiia bacterium]|nr:hypothetical protein [Chlamydiia bacterium]
LEGMQYWRKEQTFFERAGNAEKKDTFPITDNEQILALFFKALKCNHYDIEKLLKFFNCSDESIVNAKAIQEHYTTNGQPNSEFLELSNQCKEVLLIGHQKLSIDPLISFTDNAKAACAIYEKITYNSKLTQARITHPTETFLTLLLKWNSQLVPHPEKAPVPSLYEQMWLRKAPGIIAFQNNDSNLSQRDRFLQSLPKEGDHLSNDTTKLFASFKVPTKVDLIDILFRHERPTAATQLIQMSPELDLFTDTNFTDLLTPQSFPEKTDKSSMRNIGSQTTDAPLQDSFKIALQKVLLQKLLQKAIEKLGYSGRFIVPDTYIVKEEDQIVLYENFVDDHLIEFNSKSASKRPIPLYLLSLALNLAESDLQIMNRGNMLTIEHNENNANRTLSIEHNDTKQVRFTPNQPDTYVCQALGIWKERVTKSIQWDNQIEKQWSACIVSLNTR